jgi:alpha-1,3/alpha-1,6-mannosyltransferase
LITSLNRYERKKNIPLAIKAFAESGATGTLVIAGGWDPRVAENVEHEVELRTIAQQAGVSDKIVFLKSISND